MLVEWKPTNKSNNKLGQQEYQNVWHHLMQEHLVGLKEAQQLFRVLHQKAFPCFFSLQWKILWLRNHSAWALSGPYLSVFFMILPAVVPQEQKWHACLYVNRQHRQQLRFIDD